MAGPNPIVDPPAPPPAAKKQIAELQEKIASIVITLDAIEKKNLEIEEVQTQILKALLEWENYEGYELINRGTYHGVKFD